jgi:aryl-alcohol dehydrogenase-like predicted oxidoreductase
MGEAFKELKLKREEIVVTTKIFFGTKREDPNQKGLSRKHIIEGLKASLKRMQLDYVDIVYAHRPDPSVPIEETVRAFNWCIDNGLAFYWGMFLILAHAHYTDPTKFRYQRMERR